MGGNYEPFQNVLADLLLWVVVVIAREPWKGGISEGDLPGLVNSHKKNIGKP